MLLRIWRSVRRAFASLLGRWRLYRAELVEDVPDRLAPGVVYLVGTPGCTWSAAMRCPGGCGRTLEMNLLESARPVWRCTQDADRAVTLHPSVWLKTGCGCHFVLRRGRVTWV